MRDEPGKGCRIYRLYFSEADPSDVALRRWIWSLPSRKRGHIIKSILRKQLADWGRMKGRSGARTLAHIRRPLSHQTARPHEAQKPREASSDIQSMINRAFPMKDPAS